MSTPPTHVSCLTPPGAGAIAVLAVSGPHSWELLRELFRPASGKPLPEQPGEVGIVWFGHVGDGDAADEVVLTVNALDPSPWLELHCHGGRAVVEWLTELFQVRGATPLPWGEFLTHAAPAIEAQAFRLLAHAPTVRTASILLDQLNGAYPAARGAIDADIEAGRIDAARQRIDELLRHAELGRHLVEPWRVVVAGPPNVGKSSLVNALAGYHRSVVAPVAGTTRDVVSTPLAIDGWPVELLDTAGLRDGSAGLEREGIELARDVLRSADLVLWLVDGSDASPAGPDPATRAGARNLLVVANKCDLPTFTEMAGADLRISALTGEGIAGLCAAISRRLVPDPPPAGSAVPFLAAQVEDLRRQRDV